jgi:aldehyde:ferredoxin oxidoreductase
MKILRVNMSKLSTDFEDLPEEWKLIGGRALTAKILNKEVPPSVDPVGPEAKLVIACGPVAGTRAPSCGRVSFGAKSPLTLGIKEANTGGPMGQKLDRLGIRAIIVEGAPEDGQYYLLKITKNEVSLVDAEPYKGKKNYDLLNDLYAVYDKKAALVSIGIAGERGYRAAAITMTDKDGDTSRHAARGGLGAVMAAKGLKAMVIDEKGTPNVEIADRDAYRAAVKNWATVTKENPMLKNMADFGTPGVISALRFLGSMPALNFSNEQLDGVENISGEAIKKLNEERDGKMEGCMPGCLVKCSIVFKNKEKKHVTSSYEYETIALMGTNLGLVDPDVIAELDRLADTIGVDTIEVGAAMGVAASAGKMEMGNADSAFALIDEIEKGTELGAALANGVVATCKYLGVDRIPAYKGQAIAAHDGRVVKAMGVTYATSPMGADHTAGVTYEAFSEAEGAVERSLEAQIHAAIRDSLGYCELATPDNKFLAVTFLKDVINARFGINVTEEDLIDIGKGALKDELQFNQGSEFLTAHPADPEFARTEPVGPNASVFDVNQDEINTIWEKLDAYEFPKG